MIIVDTWAWVALALRRDQHHRQAKATHKRLAGLGVVAGWLILPVKLVSLVRRGGIRMSLTIPSDVQQRVNVLLSTGRYASEEAILRAAVAALEEQNAELAAIQGGINDMENGRYRAFADFDAEFRQRNRIENGA